MTQGKLFLLDLDLKALSEPVIKLLDTISGAAGILYEPTRIRRKSKAEADALIIKVEGEIELQEMAIRASERITTLELRRQKNIEAVITAAANQLPENVSDAKVDEDWVWQFFNYVQDVGNEEMQLIWGRLLANEVASPGSYSPRTLHVVRHIQPEDARMFCQFSNYFWLINDDPLHIVTSGTDQLLDEKGIKYAAMLHLETLGLISMPPNLSLMTGKYPISTAEYFGRRYLAGDEPQVASIAVRIPTEVGQELSPLCDPEPDEEYHSAILDHLAEKGIHLSEQRD